MLESQQAVNTDGHDPGHVESAGLRPDRWRTKPL